MSHDSPRVVTMTDTVVSCSSTPRLRRSPSMVWRCLGVAKCSHGEVLRPRQIPQLRTLPQPVWDRSHLPRPRIASRRSPVVCQGPDPFDQAPDVEISAVGVPGFEPTATSFGNGVLPQSPMRIPRFDDRRPGCRPRCAGSTWSRPERSRCRCSAGGTGR